MDIWSLGCILAELLSGAVLFQVCLRSPYLPVKHAHQCQRVMPDLLQRSSTEAGVLGIGRGLLDFHQAST